MFVGNDVHKLREMAGLAGKEKSCYGVECDFFWKKLNADATATTEKSARFCSCSAQ